jgi:radical SAM protein with 4Fe4S-binding SPASM domain
MIGMEHLIEPFDQLVKIEKGPVNSAIIDLVRGKVFQIPNHVVFNFRPDDLNDISQFMKTVQQEQKVIDLNKFRRFKEQESHPKEEELELEIRLHIEEEAALDEILEAFADYPVKTVYYYGQNLPTILSHNRILIKREKDFKQCQQRSLVDGHFNPVKEGKIRFNKQYNSCWGASIAFTADGSVRPCVHSQLIIDRQAILALEDVDGLIEQMQPYWHLTKDKVNKCLACEFRHLCFDCREIAWRQNGDILSPNPNCKYNPFTGHWNL